MNKETLEDIIGKIMIKEIYNYADRELELKDISSIKEAIYDSSDKITKDLGLIHITDINKDEINFNIDDKMFFNIDNTGIIRQKCFFGDIYVNTLKPAYIYAMNTGFNYIAQKEALEKINEYENSLKSETYAEVKDKNNQILDDSIII